MATKARRSFVRRRSRRVGDVTYRHITVTLIARCLSSIFLMIVARWLHVPVPGGE